MTSTTSFFLFIPLISFILLAINIIFAPRNPYMEKNNAFECGFTSFVGQNRIQFSISFFIFALLFLLFDLEILLVYPYLMSAYNNETYGLLILIIFLIVLTIGFIFELGKKALTIDSRQTMWSNINTMKKSLSTISDTTFSVMTSVLFTKNLFIRGSTLINKKLNNLDVKSKNFHTTSPPSGKKEYNLYGTKAYSTIFVSKIYGSNNTDESIRINKHYLTTQSEDKTTLYLAKKNFCFSTILQFPKIPVSISYNNQKRSFSTTNTLNGLGMMNEIRKVNKLRNEYKSYILNKRDEDYYQEGYYTAKEVYKNACSGTWYSKDMKKRSLVSDKVYREIKIVENVERYYKEKFDAIHIVNREHANKLYILKSNLLYNDRLPSLRYNRIPNFGGGRRIKRLDYAREALRDPVEPIPTGSKSYGPCHSSSFDPFFNFNTLRRPYFDDYRNPEDENYYKTVESSTKGDPDSKSIYEDSIKELSKIEKSKVTPDIMIKPKLTNRDLGGNPIDKPLEPIEMPIIRYEEPVKFENNPSWWIKQPSNENLTRHDFRQLDTSTHLDPINTVSAMCLFTSFEVSEVSVCLRFLSVLAAMVKAQTGTLSPYMLICRIKYSFTSLYKITKVICIGAVFIAKIITPIYNNNNNTKSYNSYYYKLNKNNKFMLSNSLLFSMFNIIKFIFIRSLYVCISNLKSKFYYK